MVCCTITLIWSGINFIVLLQFALTIFTYIQMNILVLTSIYPADDIPNTFTPIPHYFARERVKDGHRVEVINSFSVYPSIYYKAAKLIGTKHIVPFVGYSIMQQNYRYANIFLIDVFQKTPYRNIVIKLETSAILKTLNLI